MEETAERLDDKRGKPSIGSVMDMINQMDDIKTIMKRSAFHHAQVRALMSLKNKRLPRKLKKLLKKRCSDKNEYKILRSITILDHVLKRFVDAKLTKYRWVSTPWPEKPNITGHFYRGQRNVVGETREQYDFIIADDFEEIRKSSGIPKEIFESPINEKYKGIVNPTPYFKPKKVDNNEDNI